jgi:hypothetical protein
MGELKSTSLDLAVLAGASFLIQSALMLRMHPVVLGWVARAGRQHVQQNAQ